MRHPYEDLMRHVQAHGVAKADRTGTGTKSVFGHQMRFPLRAGFPLVTTKKVPFRAVALELLWFLRGDGNARWLQDRKVGIWDEWADENGDLGAFGGPLGVASQHDVASPGQQPGKALERPSAHDHRLAHGHRLEAALLAGNVPGDDMVEPDHAIVGSGEIEGDHTATGALIAGCGS
jgi:hypothetical protein